ncbi:MAG TPA: M23 family metallopeptidase [Patescibacteria group bacterium]|nr:M23 family metallopeptidase [Patescibacteria group bacterium]
MQKLSIELPKYRLMFNYRLVKRRKPLLDEPIIPAVKTIKKKYRTGTILGKFARYISEHRSVRKLFVGNMAAAVIATSFIPTVKINDVSASDEGIIQTQTQLVTEKGIQIPVNLFKVNQGFNFFHPGLDIGGPVGEGVRPIKSGVVVEAGYARDGYGNTVVVNHENGMSSRYAHLSKIEVKIGDKVDMNTEIGRLGLTGRTTGPHLHLEIHENGVAINPLTVLPR